MNEKEKDITKDVRNMLLDIQKDVHSIKEKMLHQKDYGWGNAENDLDDLDFSLDKYTHARAHQARHSVHYRTLAKQAPQKVQVIVKGKDVTVNPYHLIIKHPTYMDTQETHDTGDSYTDKQEDFNDTDMDLAERVWNYLRTHTVSKAHHTRLADLLSYISFITDGMYVGEPIALVNYRYIDWELKHANGKAKLKQSKLSKITKRIFNDISAK